MADKSFAGGMPPQPPPLHRRAAPLDGLGPDEMQEKIANFLERWKIGRSNINIPDFRRGAFLARAPGHYRLRNNDDGEDSRFGEDDIVLVSEDEHKWLKMEAQDITTRNFFTNFKAYSSTVYQVIVCCSLGAAVQGFDETAVNGGK